MNMVETNTRKTNAVPPSALQSGDSRIILPAPPASEAGETDERAFYGWFVKHLRDVPNSRIEIKILSAIQFTADALGYSDAHIAKSLVDMGLRAPRMAFPSDFLSFADSCLLRSGWEVGGPSASLLALKKHWDAIGEDRFAAFKRDYSLLDEKVF